jgi:hypothetical protein
MAEQVACLFPRSGDCAEDIDKVQGWLKEAQSGLSPEFRTF